MKWGIVIFPGTNCERDVIHVLRNVYHQDVVSLWHKDTIIPKIDALILPGGFSYGDYLRAGAIARFSPINDEILRAAKSGLPIFGICNGFQILTELGLLPGALLINAKGGFLCRDVYIKSKNSKSFSSCALSDTQVIRIPINHGMGRYYANDITLKELYENEQIVFTYCNENGVEENSYEVNPNGSLNNIAGICSKEKNIAGMMPHPERASEYEIGNIDGKYIFDSMIQFIQSR